MVHDGSQTQEDECLHKELGTIFTEVGSDFSDGCFRRMTG